MLSQLNPYVLRSFDKIWVLDDAADPEPAEAEEQAESRDGASGKDERVQDTEVLPLLGLHAKLYVSEHGWLASLLTGSANATTAAFDRNVEFMVELTGKKSRCGIEAILGRPDSSKRGGLACLRDLLVEYTSSGVKTRIDETVRAFEQQVDRLSRQMASQTPIAKVAATESPDTFSVTLQPTKKCQLDDLQGCRVRARPLSHSADQLHDVQYTHEQWVRFESVSLLGLTSFYVLVVESADQKLTRQFVLNVPLEDAPAHRQDFILRNMLGDSDRVLRFLLLLLMDTGARDIGTVFGEAKLGTDHSTFIQSLFGTTLFESLVRSLARDPERIDHVAEVIDDLRMTSEGRRLLPANLDAIWNPVWTIRQKQIADLGTKRKGAR
jgi:hypothetical protein